MLTRPLFIKSFDRDIILIQVYVDDIIFGLLLKRIFVKNLPRVCMMNSEMSHMGELQYFLGLTDQANEGRQLHSSREVHEGLAEALRDGNSFTQVNSI